MKVKYRGATFEVEVEAIPALLSQLGIGPYQPRSSARSLSRTADHEETLVAVLRALLARSDGLSSEDLAALIGVADARGIPRVVRVWRAISADVGFDLADVLMNVRQGPKRYWKACSKAKAALRALDERRVGKKRGT